MPIGMLYRHALYCVSGMIVSTHDKCIVISYPRGLWVVKNRLKSVVMDLEIRSCKQLKIRQESAKMES